MKELQRKQFKKRAQTIEKRTEKIKKQRRKRKKDLSKNNFIQKRGAQMKLFF